MNIQQKQNLGITASNESTDKTLSNEDSASSINMGPEGKQISSQNSESSAGVQGNSTLPSSSSVSSENHGDRGPSSSTVIPPAPQHPHPPPPPHHHPHSYLHPPVPQTIYQIPQSGPNPYYPQDPYYNQVGYTSYPPGYAYPYQPHQAQQTMTAQQWAQQQHQQQYQNYQNQW